MSKVMVIAVHPDDETLGCGGTLLKHRGAGDEIYWCIVTAMSEDLGYTEAQIRQREGEISRAAGTYGFARTLKLGLPPAGLDGLDTKEVMGPLKAALEEVRPDTLYLPFIWDVHSDHRVVFNAVWSCIKPFRAPYIKTVLMMETLSETDMAVPLAGQSFVPNRYVDITDYMDKKVEIMRLFDSEIKLPPFPRSEKGIRALARLRGGSAGCDFAESFMTLRELR